MPDYLLAAHIQVTGGSEAAAQLQIVQTQINNFTAAAKNAGTGQMAGDFEKAAQSGSTFSNVMDRVGSALIRMATYQGISLIEGGIRNAAGAVLDFNDAMVNSLSIQSGVTQTMRADMESLAETIAVRLGEAPAEVAKGFYYLASAGLTVDQQMADLPVVANFAKAGLMNLDQATEMLLDSLTALGLKVDDPAQQMINLTELADKLTEAAIRSQGTIQDFGSALANKAGADMKAYGINLNEGIGLLEVFADRGIKGAKAGTAFDQVIRDLTIKAVGHADAFKKLGIEVFDSEGNFNSLVTIMQQVDAALLHLPLEDRTKALKDMGFTLKSGQLIQGLLGTSDALKAFVDDLSHAGGKAEDVASKQMESLRAKLDQLKSAFQVGAIQGFDQLLVFADWLANTFRPAIEAIGPAAAAMGRGIGDVAEGFLALGVAASRISLEAIAFGIQHIGEFASQHQGAVEAFGIALASISAARAIEGIVGLAGAISGNLLGRLSEATTSLQVIGLEMMDVMRAGGGLSGAFTTGMSGLMELFNPITLGLTAIAAGIGIIWKQHQDSVNEAKQQVKDLTNAMGSALGVTADEASAALAHLRSEVDNNSTSFTHMADVARQALSDDLVKRLSDNGLAQAFSEIGVSARDAAAALSTGTNFFQGWTQDTKTIAEMRAQLDTLPASVRPVAEALLNARDSGKISYAEFFRLADVLDNTADASDHVAQKFADFARQQLANAVASGTVNDAWLKQFGIMDLGKASVDQLLSAMDALDKQEKDTPANANRMGEGARLVKEKLDAQTQATDDAEAALKRFNDSLKELAGGADKDFAAFTSAGSAITSLVASMQGVPVSFDGTTEASRKQRDALQGAADAGMKLAEAHAAATQSADQGAAAAMGYSRGLADVLKNADLTTAQVEVLLEQFGMTPDQIKTLFQVDTTEASSETKATEQRFHDLAVESANAQKAIDGVKKALDEFIIPASTMEATARLGDKMLDFQDAANKYVAEQGPLATAFESHSRAANGLVEQLSGLIRGQAEFAQTMLDQGKTQEAIDGMTNLKNSVHDLLVSYGLTDDQIHAVLVSFGLTDEAIAKLQPGVVIPVAQSGAEAVADTLNNTAAPNGQPRTANVQANPTNVQPTDNTLNTVARNRDAMMWAQADGNFLGHTESQLNTTARGRSPAMFPYVSGGNDANNFLNSIARSRTAYIRVQVDYAAAQAPYIASGEHVPYGAIAEGGIVHAYASGGFENHVAQIGRMGAARLWNEPETGGESYIPLSPLKRDRSIPIWEETGRMLGVKAGGPTVNIHSPTSVTINGSHLSASALEAAVASGVNSANEQFARRLLVELQTR